MAQETVSVNFDGGEIPEGRKDPFSRALAQVYHSGDPRKYGVTNPVVSSFPDLVHTLNDPDRIRMYILYCVEMVLARDINRFSRSNNLHARKYFSALREHEAFREVYVRFLAELDRTIGAAISDPDHVEPVLKSHKGIQNSHDAAVARIDLFMKPLWILFKMKFMTLRNLRNPCYKMKFSCDALPVVQDLFEPKKKSPSESEEV